MRLLTFGEVLGVAATFTGDPLRTTRTLRLSTAGAEGTVAIGVSRLGHHSVFAGRVGADTLGERVIRDLAGEGVDTASIQAVEGAATAFMLRELRTAERTVVSYYRSGSAGSGLNVRDVQAAFERHPNVDLMHVTGITPGLSPTASHAIQAAVELARQRAITVSFDVNYRHTLPLSTALAPILQWLVERSDLVFVGDDELAVLDIPTKTDPIRAAQELTRRGPAEVVVKCGAEGAIAVLADGTTAVAPSEQVQVADAIGAGDSFVAGYLASRAENAPPQQRLQWGNACGARTVGTSGDWEGLPTRSELTATGVSR